MTNLDPDILIQSIMDTLNFSISNLFGVIPYVLGSILIVVIGYFVSEIIGRIVSGILDHLKVEDVLQKYRVEDALGGTEISPLLATAAKWYVMLLFLTSAIEVLNLSSVNWLITAALMFAPVLLGVGLLIIVAAITGEWVREAILDLHKFHFQKTIAVVSKWAIVLLALVVSLETIGFQMGFIRDLFNTLLQGAVYGIAIAFGLAFGLGGQKDAQDVIRKTRKKLKF